MATDRTINPQYPMVTTARIAHEAIGARDATIGRASSLEHLEWTGRFSGALILILPVTAVEETPDLGSQPGVDR
jgi:hypothetical protein